MQMRGSNTFVSVASGRATFSLPISMAAPTAPSSNSSSMRSVRSMRWKENENTLQRTRDGFVIDHPTKIDAKLWVDDMKLWPSVAYANIFNYFVLSEGVDGEEMENYKSMDSYNYFQSEKVGTIYIYAPAEGLCLVRADVTPSQTEHRDKHQAWCLLTTKGVVETAGCTCLAGRGRSCSHAGAILWKMEYAAATGRSGSGCTDQQQQWNRGTMRNLEPKRLGNINFRRPSRQLVPDLDQPLPQQHPLPEPPSYVSKEDFYREVKVTDMGALINGADSLVGKCYRAEVETSSEAVAPVHGDHINGNCSPCKTFYDKLVSLDTVQIKHLSQETKAQSSSTVWQDARRIRITASTAKKVPVKESTNPDRFLKDSLYPSFRGNHATEHGRVSEVKAIRALTEMGVGVRGEGSVVAADEPWLSASPDGITEDGRLVEVKCPLVKKDFDKFTDLFSSSYCDVIMKDGTPVLEEKGKRGYYMQVQLTMFCTGLKECIFFVWSERGHLLVPVKFNTAYVDHHVNRLRRFYFSSMLPRLTDDYLAGRLKICKTYKQIAQN